MLTGQKLTIFGCGGHSRSVADILIANQPKVSITFIDSNAAENEYIYGFPVKKDWLMDDTPVFIAVGDNRKRKEKLDELGNITLVSIVSSKSHIGYGADLGIGCFVGNYCHIGPSTQIGKNTILNNAAIIEHEVKIGEHCHIGPNATISGRSNIGDLVFIGAGSVVKDYITICDHVTIGAGSTVINNITEPGVYVGTPVKRIR